MSQPFDQTLRAVSRDSHRGNWLLVAGGVGLLALWLAVALRLPLPVLLESAEGRIVSARAPSRIVASTEEPITTVAVRLGDRVARGDLLVRFDQTNLQLELQSGVERLEALRRQRAQLRLELRHLAARQAQELVLFGRSLERIEARLDEARAAIEYAEFREQTFEALHSDRLIDALQRQEATALARQERQRLRALAIEGEEVQASRELAQRRWQAEVARHERTLARLEGDIAELEPQLRLLRREIASLELRAPHDAVIEGMAPITVGETLPRNTWLMTLGGHGDYQFEARFPAARAAARLEPGLPARIAFTALPWTEYGTLGARVSRVGNEERSDLITVQFELDRHSTLAERLGHGLAGRAIVEVDRVTIVDRLLYLMTRPGR